MRQYLRALITRPEQDAEKTKAKLEQRGFDVMTEALLTIVPCVGSKPKIVAAIARKPQAILITSANGIRVLAEYSDERDLQIFTVGNFAAQIAKDLGYENVVSASGDVHDLGQVVKNSLDSEGSFLLHVAGSVVAGDLQQDLASDGFDVQRVTAYDAVAAKELTPGLKIALVNCEIDFVVFYSARTANIFEALMQHERIHYLSQNIEAYSLSPTTKFALEWKRVHIAKRPDEDSLLELIDTQTLGKMPL